MLYVSFFFFFSSRRRHTRYWRDWSSDVCSSDLPCASGRASPPSGRPRAEPPTATAGAATPSAAAPSGFTEGQIGRAAGGGRGEILVGGGSLKKKKKIHTWHKRLLETHTHHSARQ